MGGIIGGGSNSGDIKRQQEAQQRRQLADLARQQAEIDQSKATGGGGPRKSGSALLTFLSGNGADTFG